MGVIRIIESKSITRASRTRSTPVTRLDSLQSLPFVLQRYPLVGLAVLAAAALLAYLVQGGMSERVRTTWSLANAYDRAVSATMPGAWLFRAAVAWAPRQLPSASPHDAPYLAAMLGYAASIAVLFALYALALRWTARHAGTGTPALRQRIVVLIGGAAAIFSLVLLFTPAAPSHDPFAYAMSGRLLLAYHANPFFAVPASYPHDPILAANDWKQSATAYGPLWSGISLLLAPLIGADPLRANMVYRVVALVAHLANILLIAALLRRLPAGHQSWQARGLLLYAWNPLVVVEVAAGHNDVAMLTLLLLGLYLLARERPALAMVSLAGAILLKASALPLVLLVLAALLLASARARTAHSPLLIAAGRGSRAMRAALVLTGVVIAGYLPFFWGHSPARIAAASRLQPTTQALAKALTSSFGTLSSAVAQAPLFPSPLAAALSHAVLVLSSPTFWTLVQAILMLAAAFFLLPSLPNRERLPSALAWVYAMWMALLCVFHLLRTWYLIPLVGLISLTPLGRPIRRFVLTLTTTAQIEIFFLSQSPPFGGWQPWTVVLVLGIPLAVLVVELRRQGFAPRAAAAHSLATLLAMRAS